MELEMTKVDNERDIEQLQQQKEDDKKEIDDELHQIRTEKEAL